MDVGREVVIGKGVMMAKEHAEGYSFGSTVEVSGSAAR